ncbi:putative transmembrane anti-sigma factor [Rubrobacter xylanophilus DSM 9941]|uniref:Regulator of SigK n=1 Tax=Rubrobacter xylanophilus (strain DSM 9941 / JCM 11954 / NBRC 16129 / PRD-1) TaxID=266117 RepID=Q1AXH2_RUBXD|nr:anti-sigma factor [Rubrobacter xylanophilus]ABG03906.1 putative transmembrane anti-sigma factor [Rubrobacter xylanophilus DSM 9941]
MTGGEAHDRARERLGPYLLGQLEPGERAEVEEHLRECPACREELRELGVAHAALRAAAALRPPETVRERLPRGRSALFGRPALAAALLAVLVVAGALYAALHRPDTAEAMTATLSPTGLAPEARGELRMEEAGGNMRVRLEVSGLPPLGRGEYYELWFVRDGHRISCGGFTVDEAGRASVVMNAPKVAYGYRRVGVTREHSPGDPGPSPERVLHGRLQES